MKKSFFRAPWISALSLALALPCLCTSLVLADEGMFTFDKPPRRQVLEKFNFNMSEAWLEHAQKAAVRFNNGGSGGFVSADGLVLTNHHIADEVLSQLSTPDNNLLEKGFLAPDRAGEPKSPNLELNCLQSIEDVTARVQAAVKPGASAEEANAQRQAAISAIEKESLEATGLRSDVVTLYQGGRYHLYRYKKYTDVRLVWAPEQAIASFGGDTDNFEYPRRSLDAAMFRVYENGQPVHPESFFQFEPGGVREGDPVFVIGHPGTTNRMETSARIRHYQDRLLPYRLARCRAQEAALYQFSALGAEQARRADNPIHSVANTRKACTGMFRGLLNQDVITRRDALENQLRSQVKDQSPWEEIAKAQDNLSVFEESYYLLENGDALPSPLFRLARHLVRLSAELKKPNGERLPSYRDSKLESLKASLLSPEPIYADLEKARLTAGLSFLAERLGCSHPDVQMILQGKSPDKRAQELVDGCTLFEVSRRQALMDGGSQAIAASTDSMIQLARAVDERSRALEKRYDAEVKEPELKAYAQIAEERFKIEGDNVPPDATFTLRLSYGVTKGYQADGQDVPWCTTFNDAFAKEEAMKGRAPYSLPPTWLKARQEGRLNLDTRFDFVATSDTIGGNSGSPVINRDGKLVGVNFDRNQYGMVRNFIYDEKQARHISVSADAIIEALRHIYKADRLVKELSGQ